MEENTATEESLAEVLTAGVTLPSVVDMIYNLIDDRDWLEEEFEIATDDLENLVNAARMLGNYAKYGTPHAHEPQDVAD